MRQLIIVTLLAATLTSCFDDETTNAQDTISEIIITEGTIESVYDIEKNDTLTIAPQYTQTNQQKEVSFTWEIDQETYSNDSIFIYVGESLGTFQCRLILENEDGKTFHTFVLYVDSPYEEGITIISADDYGNSMLSFMLAGTEDSIGFIDGDCFTINNPDYTFAANPVDMVQSDGWLIIACQGEDNSEEAPATIYYLNEKTFTVENELTVAEYSNFIPTKLGIPSVGFSGTSYPVLCEDGSVFEFSTSEGNLTLPVKLTSNYAQRLVEYDTGTGYNFDIVLWDNEVGDLTLIYNGYGPYFCSEIYLCEKDSCTGSNNYFNGKTFITMAYVEMTDEQETTSTPTILVITKSGSLYQRTQLKTTFWYYDEENLETKLYDNGGSKMCGTGTVDLDDTTPCIANMTYYSFLFANGNQVMRWNYTTSQLLNKADVLATVGSDNAVITDFEISQDHTQTYVAYYEPEETGLNGHLSVIDTDTGELLKQYDNISYKPNKVIYKVK